MVVVKMALGGLLDCDRRTGVQLRAHLTFVKTAAGARDLIERRAGE